MKKLIPVIFICLGLACSIYRSNRLEKKFAEYDEYKPLGKEVITIRYELIDVPAERRIVLTYQNDFNRNVCWSEEFWPSQSGMLSASPQACVLVVGQRRFPLKRGNDEYRMGTWSSVAPGETAVASLSYDNFNLPDELVNEDKKLEFISYAFFCEKRKK